ncbi:MAG: HNH endonuclease, partial [Alphaproteobacteria bacterium]|nr:HNH endonuclease [Alphaproteobacteria bacterium]
LANGQVLCAQHNFKKKNYNQTETAKRLFVNLQAQAKELGDEKTENFAKAVLKTYEKHDVNGHIEWKED